MDLASLIEEQERFAHVLIAHGIEYVKNPQLARDYSNAAAVAIDKLMTLKANDEFQPSPGQMAEWVRGHPDRAAVVLREAR